MTTTTPPAAATAKKNCNQPKVLEKRGYGFDFRVGFVYLLHVYKYDNIYHEQQQQQKQ